MFTLTLHDRKGTQLKMGDIVKISNGRAFTFFAEVKYLEPEKIIAPFHTFTFHSFEKVDKAPDKAEMSTETRYKIWFVQDEDAEPDNDAESAKDYLMSWRDCEVSLEKRVFRITPVTPTLF